MELYFPATWETAAKIQTEGFTLGADLGLGPAVYLHKKIENALSKRLNPTVECVIKVDLGVITSSFKFNEYPRGSTPKLVLPNLYACKMRREDLYAVFEKSVVSNKVSFETAPYLIDILKNIMWVQNFKGDRVDPVKVNGFVKKYYNPYNKFMKAMAEFLKSDFFNEHEVDVVPKNTLTDVKDRYVNATFATSKALNLRKESLKQQPKVDSEETKNEDLFFDQYASHGAASSSSQGLNGGSRSTPYGR